VPEFLTGGQSLRRYPTNLETGAAATLIEEINYRLKTESLDSI